MQVLTAKTIGDPYPPNRPVENLAAAWRRIYERFKPIAIGNIGLGNVLITPEDVRRLMTSEGADAVIEKLFGRGWDNGLNMLGGEKPDDAVFFGDKPESAIRFLLNYKVKLAQSTSDTVNAKLTEALAQTLAEGEGGGTAAQRVADVLDGYGQYQAQRVAVTESARAYGEGKVESWKDSEVVTKKEWLLSANPCALCRAIWMQKRVVSVTQPFLALNESIVTEDGVVVNDYAAMNSEPAHPHCSCATAPVIDLG